MIVVLTFELTPTRRGAADAATTAGCTALLCKVYHLRDVRSVSFPQVWRSAGSPRQARAPSPPAPCIPNAFGGLKTMVEIALLC